MIASPCFQDPTLTDRPLTLPSMRNQSRSVLQATMRGHKRLGLARRVCASCDDAVAREHLRTVSKQLAPGMFSV